MARGHIRKRGNGYAVVIELPRDPVTNKRRQKWVSAKTKKEAEKLLNQSLHDLDRGTYVEPTKLTVAEYLKSWHASIESSIRPSSHRRFGEVVTNHLIPGLGSIPLAKLTPLHVQELYTRLLTSGLSPTTVNLIHNVLHRALDRGVKSWILPRNVCDAVDAPRPAQVEIKTWNAAQAASFLSVAVGEELAALWYLALLTGMRRGELLALHWEDVDLQRGRISVRRTLSRGRAGITFGEPKSRAGRRSIAIPSTCIRALQEHRVRQLKRRLQVGQAWQEHDLVFDRGDGTFLHPNTLTNAFKRLTVKADVPVIRLHDLRHTAATLMLEDGTHPKIVQERLGHSDISMTLNRYSHVTMDMQREAADRLSDRLLGS